MGDLMFLASQNTKSNVCTWVQMLHLYLSHAKFLRSKIHGSSASSDRRKAILWRSLISLFLPMMMATPSSFLLSIVSTPISLSLIVRTFKVSATNWMCTSLTVGYVSLSGSNSMCIFGWTFPTEKKKEWTNKWINILSSIWESIYMVHYAERRIFTLSHPHWEKYEINLFQESDKHW